ncbi:MAG: transcription antitermination factor NusB [Alphaproteobacteria bacterium]|nr:transcription antitermination factor NusB [Alphaproteobacteria bacterium]
MIEAPEPGGHLSRRGSGQSRSAARLAAVQALYQLEFGDAGPVQIAAVVEEFSQHRLGREVEGEQYRRADREHFVEVVRGVHAGLGEIDAMIASALAPGWALARIGTLQRAILRAGAHELRARPDVPVRVVINEYVDVAHAFFHGDEPAFVNGLLDRLARVLREAEFQPPPA